MPHTRTEVQFVDQYVSFISASFPKGPTRKTKPRLEGGDVFFPHTFGKTRARSLNLNALDVANEKECVGGGMLFSERDAWENE